MKELAQEVQMVIEALNGNLEGLPTTYKNCAILSTCIEKLIHVRDKLSNDDIKVEVCEDNGNADTE